MKGLRNNGVGMGVLGLCLVVAAAARAAPFTYYENFDASAVGQVPIDWTAVLAGNGTIGAAPVFGTSNKIMHMRSINQGDRAEAIGPAFPLGNLDFNRPYVIEFDFNYDKSNDPNGFHFFEVMALNGPGALTRPAERQIGLFLDQPNDSRVGGQDSLVALSRQGGLLTIHTLGALKEDLWYHFKIDAFPGSQTYDLTITDSQGTNGLYDWRNDQWVNQYRTTKIPFIGSAQASAFYPLRIGDRNDDSGPSFFDHGEAFWDNLAIGGSSSVPLSRGMTYSLDYQGPTAVNAGPGMGAPGGFFGVPLDEGQILTPAAAGPPGPNPPAAGPLAPGVMVDSVAGSPQGIVSGGLGIAAGLAGAVELDALSYGRDLGKRLAFSVDEFACGDAALGPLPGPPNVFTEGALIRTEAAADVFVYHGPAVLTPPPGAPPFPAVGPGNAAVIDGDGMGPFGGPGSGLLEPNLPTPLQTPDMGDNLDALDVNTLTRHVNSAIFFSMDAGFADPLEAIAGAPPNTGTAAGNADGFTGIPFSGGDVVVTVAGSLPVLYAGAATLGLDRAGFDADDLDALALIDDGAIDSNTGLPFFTAGQDSILFSVRRGSAVIGVLDSRYGLPIEPGDVLTTPTLPGQPPSIFIPAEFLGLGTLRSLTLGPFGADDLDALDIVSRYRDRRHDMYGKEDDYVDALVNVPEPMSLGMIILGLMAWFLKLRRWLTSQI